LIFHKLLLLGTKKTEQQWSNKPITALSVNLRDYLYKTDCSVGVFEITNFPELCPDTVLLPESFNFYFEQIKILLLRRHKIMLSPVSFNHNILFFKKYFFHNRLQLLLYRKKIVLSIYFSEIFIILSFY